MYLKTFKEREPDMLINKKISIVFLSYHSKKLMKSAFETVAKTLEAEQIPFEFIVIDDGSKDGSFDVANSAAIIPAIMQSLPGFPFAKEHAPLPCRMTASSPSIRMWPCIDSGKRETSLSSRTESREMTER